MIRLQREYHRSGIPPWFSLGIHVDFKKKYMDLHLCWWILSLGKLDHQYMKDELWNIESVELFERNQELFNKLLKLGGVDLEK